MNLKSIEFINNIVFYNDDEDGANKAIIFYKDGDYARVDFETGIDACEALAHGMNVETMDQFENIMNKDIVQVMSQHDLEETVFSYTSKTLEGKSEELADLNDNSNNNKDSASEDNLENNSIDKSIENSDQSAAQDLSYENDKEKVNDDVKISESTPTDKEPEGLSHLVDQDSNDKENDKKADFNAFEEIFSSKEKGKADNFDVDSNITSHDNDANEQLVDVTDSEEVNKIIEEKPEKKKIDERISDFFFGNPYYDDSDDYGLNEGYCKEVDEYVYSPEEEKKTGIKGFFRRVLDKLKSIKFVTRIVAFVTAIACGLGLYSCTAKKTLEGKMNNSNLTSISDTNNIQENEDLLIVGDNKYYDNYTFKQLTTVTTNKFQLDSMNKLNDAISQFNTSFADSFYEKDINVKPALSFDEVVSLQNAYNDYSKEEVKAYFNGADVNANDLSDNYKTATLQLMGAHVIETREHPVDMSMLLNEKNAVDFYNNYHKLFMDAKYAKGDIQIKLVHDFYEKVRKDFPITKEERTEGIAHSDSRKKIEAYKLSVTPMIAAAEMLFQNLKVDNSLKNNEVDFINDIGLCNYADDKFERIETITLAAPVDHENPLYDQYSDAVVNSLEKDGHYDISDKNRELTKLKSFQLAVNGHFDKVASEKDGVSTKTTTQTHSKTYTTYSEDTSYKNIPITPDAKKQVDKELEKDNQKSKQDGEKQAEANRKKIQASEDKNAQHIKDEVKHDASDMNDKINKANDKISNGQTVNESDFGSHDVQFDDKHSDKNGNLDGSVDNITTDGSGDKTDEALPDPNKMGKKFDASSVGSRISNEKLVDQYVESLSDVADDDLGYQFRK